MSVTSSHPHPPPAASAPGSYRASLDTKWRRSCLKTMFWNGMSWCSRTSKARSSSRPRTSPMSSRTRTTSPRGLPSRTKAQLPKRPPRPFSRKRLSRRLAKGTGPASCVAAPLSPLSVPCFSPPRSSAATFTWTTQDISSRPTMRSSQHASFRSRRKCPATSLPSPSPTTSMSKPAT